MFPHFGLEMGDFGGLDIGGVGNDSVVFIGELGGENIGVNEINSSLGAVSDGVLLGDLESIWGDVDGVYFSVREMFGEGYDDATAACADF